MPKKKILITGCAGYIGRNLCRQLSGAGHQVLGLVRSRDSREIVVRHGGTPIISPPIQHPDAISSVQQDADVVIHLAACVHQMGRQARSDQEAFDAINVAGSEHMARLAVRCNASHFLMFSTIAVHGDRSTHEPIHSGTVTRPLTPYARSKLDGENIVLSTLRESNVDVKVIRIPMVYGKAAPGNFSRLCKLVASGIPLPLGRATSKRSLLYIENLVSAIGSIIETPERCPKIALIADNTALPVVTVIETIAAALERPNRVFAFPRMPIRLGCRLIGQENNYTSLFEPLEMDVAEFCAAMNWKAPVETRDALLLSVEETDQRRPSGAS